MARPSDLPESVDDPAFVEAMMYRGRSSRRPGLRLAAGLAFGLVMVALGVWIYQDLAAWEEAGRPERWVSGALSLLYAIGGKVLVLALVSGFGVVTILASLRGFLADRRVARRQHRA